MTKCEKTTKMISCLMNLCEKKNQILGKYFSPIVLLTTRILVALVFLHSGLTKFYNFDATIFLFENEYHVPLLSPVIAAYSATFFELTCSVLLIFGLATRLATIPLIVMTLIIQLFIVQNPMHLYWLNLLAVTLVFGAGCISLDKLVKKCAQKCTSQK